MAGPGGERPDAGWQSLYRVGSLAALLAGLVFRRNLGVEISLFSAQKPPGAVADWFTLLQTHRFLGLAYLHIFDLVNYALLGLVFLALYAALRQVNHALMLIAVSAGGVGIAVYFASNTALSMLALGDQYAAATTETQRTALLAAGQALLAVNRFTSPGGHPGAGGYLSLLFIAGASLMTSLVMLRSALFNRVTAYVGILASVFDLAYCAAYIFLPMIDRALLAVIFIPAAGLLWMVWHLLVGRALLQLRRREGHAT